MTFLLLLLFQADGDPDVLKIPLLPPAINNPRNSEGDFLELKGGLLMFAYTKFTGGAEDDSRAEIAARFSGDGGRTWSLKDTLVLPNEGRMNTMSVSLHRLQRGEIAMVYLRKNSDRDCRPYLRTSVDEAKTWSDAVPVAPDEAYYVVSNGRLVQLMSGRLVVPAARHSAADGSFRSRGQALCFLSDDAGVTWRKSGTMLEGPEGNSGLQEPVVVERKDGSLLMICRTDRGSAYRSTSTDGGETWTGAERSTIASPLSAVSVKRIPDRGDLLMAWNDHEKVDPVYQDRRTPFTVAISRDEGETWESRRVLDDDPDGWYCTTAIAFVSGRVLLGHCAGDARIGRLNRTRITSFDVDWLYKPPVPRLQLGPMAGHAGPDEFRIWVKSNRAARPALKVGEREDLSDGRVVEGPELLESTGFAGHVRVAGLKPSTKYFYTVLLDGREFGPSPVPSIRTAPPAGTPGRFRFAFVSCVGREGKDAEPAWEEMEGLSFDLLLMLGDNHYADSVEPARLRAAYASHRSVRPFAKIAARAPVLGIWDDHDYGPNNSDGTQKGKERSLEVFKAYWANPSYGQEDDPGVYFKFARGDVEFFMLDSRYHRTPNKTPEDGSKTMLGAKQLAWLKRGLEESKAKLKFVGCGSEFQPNTQPDGWLSFARERKDLFDFIEAKGVKGVILLSGDRHFTGGYQIDGKLIEITTGPLGSKNAATRNLPDMFLNHGSGKLFTIFEVDTLGPTPSAVLEVYRAGQGMIASRRFTWAEITGEKRIPPLPAGPPKDK